MADTKVAFMVTEEQKAEIDKLKKKEYYDRPYSELLRDILDAGIRAKKKGD